MNEIETIWSDARKAEYEEALNTLAETLRGIDKKMRERRGNAAIRFTEQRLKSPAGISEKLMRKGKQQTVEDAVKYVNDLAGLRVICFDVSQIYEMVDEIKQMDQIQVLKEKDYIRHPKKNGYQSYHLILICRNLKLELQIRTIIMDAWSSIETILIYKKSTPIPEQIREDIKSFSRLSKKMDRIAQKMFERNNHTE